MIDRYNVMEAIAPGSLKEGGKILSHVLKLLSAFGCVESIRFRTQSDVEFAEKMLSAHGLCDIAGEFEGIKLKREPVPE